MTLTPIWVSLSDEDLYSEFYLTCLLLTENKELLTEISACTGSCQSGQCKF